MGVVMVGGGFAGYHDVRIGYDRLVLAASTVSKLLPTSSSSPICRRATDRRDAGQAHDVVRDNDTLDDTAADCPSSRTNVSLSISWPLRWGRRC